MAIFQGRVKVTYFVQVTIAVKEDVRCGFSVDIFTCNLANSKCQSPSHVLFDRKYIGHCYQCGKRYYFRQIGSYVRTFDWNICI